MCDGWVNVCVVIDVVVWGIDLLNFDLVVYVELLSSYEMFLYCLGCIGWVGCKGIFVLIVIKCSVKKVQCILKMVKLDVDWGGVLIFEEVLECEDVCMMVDEGWVILVNESEQDMVVVLMEVFIVE